MFICKFCEKINDIDILNVLIDQINLVLEMLKNSLKTNFENNFEIYEKCLTIIKLFKEIPCNYGQKSINSSLSEIKLVDKETQYSIEENYFSINADEIKTVSGNFVNNSNYTFDDRIGMYYDNSTCYYYDAEKSLFYDAYYGAYYLYDLNTNSYQFHSQIDSSKYATIYHILYGNKVEQDKIKSIESNTIHSVDYNINETTSAEIINNINDNFNEVGDELNNSESNMHNKIKNKNIYSPDIVTLASENLLTSNLLKRPNNALSPDVEEGEITDEDQNIASDSVPPELFNCVPCIRMIVKESPKLKIHSLFVVTCLGATIGRDPSLNHLILIDDPVISKMHCSINYRNDVNRYAIQDYASQAGTFINGKRIGEAKCISDHFKLYHEDELRMGSNIFSLHIHPRNDTCSTCEPGNLILKDPPKFDEKIDIPLDRKTQLKNLKKKYGLKNSVYDMPMKTSTYVDRSQARRLRHPSTNESNLTLSNDVVSVDRPIQSNNVGHRLLKNMGWKEGQGLGVNSAGIIEPVKTELRLNEVAGLGSGESYNISLDDVACANKKKNWLKTKQRYENINH